MCDAEGRASGGATNDPAADDASGTHQREHPKDNRPQSNQEREKFAYGIFPN